MTRLPDYVTLGIIDRVSYELPNDHTWQQWVCFAFDVFRGVRQRFTIGCEI